MPSFEPASTVTVESASIVPPFVVNILLPFSPKVLPETFNLEEWLLPLLISRFDWSLTFISPPVIEL